jgi:hypothetical protein
MSNKHEGCVRGFSVYSDSWYRKGLGNPDGVLDEIMVGMYHPDGGTTGEFAIRWTMVGHESTPRIEVFNDAWDALQQFNDLLKWMASVDDEHVGPQAFADALRSFGIKDRTERTNPYTSPSEREYASWFKKAAA